jgi:hypothetical protein
MHSERCQDSQHRYFALEPMIDEDSRKVVFTIVCTQCADLVTHVVDVKKLTS